MTERVESECRLKGEVRRATVGQREEILALLAEAFPGANGGPPTSSRETHPYLWCDARVADHLTFMHGGDVAGVVGLYPYDVVTCGERFRAGGVGQVSCLKKYRGRGVMSAILGRVCEEASALDMDFMWLGGDRQRYGRYGWVRGGQTAHFETHAKYLPKPGRAADFRPLRMDRDFPRLRRFLNRLPDTVRMNEDEWRLLLETEDVGGFWLGQSFIVYRWRGDLICFGDGTPEELGRLLAHDLAFVRERDAQRWKISIDLPPRVSPLLQACQAHYWSLDIRPSDNFRVVKLASFLEKVCRAAQPRVGSGSDTLSLVNTDTGEKATIACRKGRLSVEEGAGRKRHRLATRELSEICFGLLPLDVFLRGLAPHSPLRQVLPFPAHVSHFFAV